LASLSSDVPQNRHLPSTPHPLESNYPTPGPSSDRTSHETEDVHKHQAFAADYDSDEDEEWHPVQDFGRGTKRSRSAGGERAVENKQPRLSPPQRPPVSHHEASLPPSQRPPVPHDDSVSPLDSISNANLPSRNGPIKSPSRRPTARSTLSARHAANSIHSRIRYSSSKDSLLPNADFFRRRLSINSSAVDTSKLECALVDTTIDILSRAIRSSGGDGKQYNLTDARSASAPEKEAVDRARESICNTVMRNGFPAAQQMYVDFQMMVYDDLRSTMTAQLAEEMNWRSTPSEVCIETEVEDEHTMIGDEGDQETMPL